jgi:hypothetical protein
VTVCVVVLAACATGDTIVSDSPRAVTGREIAPYEFHEECAQLATGDRLDYRFETKAPVAFEIYYKEGITFVATVTRDDVTEYAGVFQARIPRRYCLRWEAGQQGALLDFRIRLLRASAS